MQKFTNNEFHVSQILFSDKVRRYASWCSHVAYGASIVLSLSVFIPSKLEAKLIHIGSAIAAYGISNKLDELVKIAKGYEVRSHVQSEASYQDWLNHAMRPPAREVVLAQPIEANTPVKFADIREALKKPHLMILGETGSGKSVLCKYFASELKIPCIALDPHASPNDWKGARVIGQGRDYKAIGQELALLVNLMDIRYKQRDKGISQFAPLGVILDEFPAVASELGKDASSPVKLIVREARKINIKLILLAQGSEVRTLGIEGEGSLRESFAVVSLGKFATDRAKGLKDKAMIEAIAQQSRPAMIDDSPSTIPTIPDSVSLPVLPLPTDYLDLISNPQSPIAPQSSAIATQSNSTAIAPIFAKIVTFLDGRDWTRDNYIKQSITDFKTADTSLEELQGYLQFLEVKGYLETRNAGRNGLEARKI